MTDPEGAVATAFQTLVAEVDHLYSDVADRIAETRAGGEPSLAAELDNRLHRVTELVDLLESAVSVAVAAATAQRRGATSRTGAQATS